MCRNTILIVDASNAIMDELPDRGDSRMGTSESPAAIGRHTALRERIYVVLLTSPRQDWTVRTLASATGSGVATSVVRDTIYMLIAAAAMTVVPGNRVITVRLNEAGLTRLQSIVKQWQSPRATRVPRQLTARQVEAAGERELAGPDQAYDRGSFTP
jgi:hypothetical protein